MQIFREDREHHVKGMVIGTVGQCEMAPMMWPTNGQAMKK